MTSEQFPLPKLLDAIRGLAASTRISSGRFDINCIALSVVVAVAIGNVSWPVEEELRPLSEACFAYILHGADHPDVSYVWQGIVLLWTTDAVDGRDNSERTIAVRQQSFHQLSTIICQTFIVACRMQNTRICKLS